MKKIKRIITLALAVVMAMAMSLTAFAVDEGATTTNSLTATSFKVANLAKGSTVDVYTVATIENNKVVVKDWADTAELSTDAFDEMTSVEVDRVYAAFKASKSTATKAASKTAEGEATELSFSLPAGVYYLDAYTAAGDRFYNPMVVVTYDVDANGTYIAKATVETVNAKSTPIDTTKTADNALAKVGDAVKFTVSTAVPKNVSTFKLFDTTKNLSSLADATVTITDGTNTVTTEKFVKDETSANTDGRYTLTFSENSLTTFAGSTITVEYTLTVLNNIGDEAYVNELSTSNGDAATPVKGYTGIINLTKRGDSVQGDIIDGAEFTIAKQSGNEFGTALSFVKVADGQYRLALANEQGATTNLVATDGTLELTGVDEGTYKFTETKAPAGYSINADIEAVTVADDEAPTAHVYADEDFTVVDPSLIRLPFTGGMGTGIFTVLGVAIMALAAGLFFATKKRA